MKKRTDSGISAIALVDGEHYPDVIRDALRYLEEEAGYRLTAIVFLGGTEKLADISQLSYRDLPVYSGSGGIEDLRRAVEGNPAEVILDLSDEPILGYRERFALISEALSRGVSYRGGDFYFEAPSRPFICAKPAIGVWGSGKRVGKTAVSGYLARYLAEKGARPCVLTMGRGGPAEPELLARPEQIKDPYLRRRVEQGFHAASDHFEDAMMANVVSVGCRRCGGGMAGEPFYSNVEKGAVIACSQECDVVVFEGSGAAIPPVGVDAVLLVASAVQPLEYLLEYLGRYRLLLSDVVVVTICEDFLVSSDKLRSVIDGILSINPRAKVVKTVFRPRPIGDLQGKKIFLTSTAPREAVDVQAGHLAKEHGAVVVGVSSNLADREGLEKDLEGAAGAEVMATELKAAGVDTVSMFAERQGKELIYIENIPVSVDGNLEEEIDHLVALARDRFPRR
ncbi:MAG: 2,3-diphosphoglycerate synthetase [Actinobacteria bacterium]|nr:2,3-diphosphoglycerate synthetase [Actinomycetota bacterium]